MGWRGWVAAVLASLIAIFVVQNVQVVELRFLVWKLEMSRALLFPVVFGLGAAAGWMLASRR